MLRPGMTMISRAGEQIARHRCGCCGEELTPHQAVSSGVCDKPRCQEWRIEQAGLDLLKRRREQVKERQQRAAAPDAVPDSAPPDAADGKDDPG